MDDTSQTPPRMVNTAREPLRGEVEVDDTWVGGEQAGLRGSRQLRDRRAALVLVAVEKRGRASGRARMRVISDFKASTITRFLTQNVAPGSTIYTDGLKSFTGLAELGFKHVARIQPLPSQLRKGAPSAAARGLRRRVRLAAQPTKDTRRRISDAPGPRNRSQINGVPADSRRKRPQPQHIVPC